VDVALGWHVRAEDQVVWHNGGTGGYNSFMAYSTERGIGVVVLSNRSGSLADQIGWRLMGTGKQGNEAQETLNVEEPDWQTTTGLAIVQVWGHVARALPQTRQAQPATRGGVAK
jgi:CubicO group peptidase (beta-lactamase class C family)